MSNKTPIKSGEKFATPQGFKAIKNGVKAGANAQTDIERKPPWLRVSVGGGERYRNVQETVNKHRLATVCEESHCPNIGECWNHGTATIMLMGATCTRACRFCAVDTGNPKGWLDLEEPANAAQSVKLMGFELRGPDVGGPGRLARRRRRALRRLCPCNSRPQSGNGVEALTPDFNGDQDAVAKVVNSGLQVFAQNVETVERLTHKVRDPRAGYQQTLDVLAHAKQVRPDVLTKSSLMLGIGETDDEIKQTLEALKSSSGRHRNPWAIYAAYQEPLTR